MKVGDLVKWKMKDWHDSRLSHHIGILIKTMGMIGGAQWLVRWQNGKEAYTWEHHLEVICGEERQEKEEDKGKKGSVACGV